MAPQPVNQDGQTDLYIACSNPYLNQEDVIELINSYTEKKRKDSLNQKVTKPFRFKGLVSSNLNFSGYNIGDTPLHAAIQFGRLEVAEKLLELGAEVDAVNLEGNTPLHEAVLNYNTEAVKVLLKFGADARIANHDFDSPILLAQDREEYLPDNKDLKEIISALSKASLAKSTLKPNDLKGENNQDVSKNFQTNLSRVRGFMKDMLKLSPFSKKTPLTEAALKSQEYSTDKKSPPLPNSEVFKERKVTTPTTVGESYSADKFSMEDIPRNSKSPPLPDPEVFNAPASSAVNDSSKYSRGNSKFPPLPNSEVFKSIANLESCDIGEVPSPQSSPKKQQADRKNYRG